MRFTPDYLLGSAKHTAGFAAVCGACSSGNPNNATARKPNLTESLLA